MLCARRLLLWWWWLSLLGRDVGFFAVSQCQQTHQLWTACLIKGDPQDLTHHTDNLDHFRLIDFGLFQIAVLLLLLLLILDHQVRHCIWEKDHGQPMRKTLCLSHTLVLCKSRWGRVARYHGRWWAWSNIALNRKVANVILGDPVVELWYV